MMVVVKHQDKVLFQHVKTVEQRRQHVRRRQFAGWFLQQGKQRRTKRRKHAPHGAYQTGKKDSRRIVFVFQRKPCVRVTVLRQPAARKGGFAIPGGRDDERKRLGAIQFLQQPGADENIVRQTWWAQLRTRHKRDGCRVHLCGPVASTRSFSR